ncbi:condensin subunit Cnd3 [Sodiomyces alkalinus F11]|uniref:Condensin subunit Cnd3 n=1 Tax=Sodiomyces alkalinus (strain CBS 110278 / VKM F-3762 / F11) TaxID=1314773 RepID=A0A3N2PWC2_SODAK|nr:condensin subunit Cnd3 [Sodiomyces alkalinus F11]ROT38811.1 condensin subunit Cnd3 [Sodiomyces alkalinus F11]
MPGRAPGRSTRTSTAVSHKSSAMDVDSRASSASPDAPTEAPDNALRHQICNIFRDAQKNTASHRKLIVSLRKIQEQCCYEPANPKKADTNVFNETTFNNEFVRCALRVMPVKKTESAGEKVIRFIGLFLRHSNDKDNELLGDVEEDASVMPETAGTRLTSQLMETILPLLTSKDKFVRYRSTQLISHVVNSLDAIDDELFQKLRHGLLRRIHDKEAMVRSQAVLGLGRLVGNQAEAGADPDDSDGDDAGLLEKLLEVLQNDPSADVRRSLLVNLPILPNTLPYLLERARDQDAATRRAVYSRLLPALGDFRHLSLSMREKLLRWGLRDRDDNVRKSAGRLFRERWIEDCAGVPATDEDGKPVESAPNFDGLQELLERIDVVNSGVENGVALEAMNGFWEGRPDYRDAAVFDDQFWLTLSAESVFMARSFNEFCRSEGNGKYESLLEVKLPEVTKLAFYLERYISVLIEAIKRVQETSDENEEDEEEDTVEQEFIVEQMLQIALTLDYSDEVGRRKMFALLRQSLSIPELPDEITKLTVNVLREICAPDLAGEKEFCSIVLEAVADVHDTIADDTAGPANDADTTEDSFHSAKSEVSLDAPAKKAAARGASTEEDEEEARQKAIKEIMINMKCLYIVQCMLTNVAGDLQQNDHLVAMLNNLVVPAVRSHEAPVRERGLVCLGLCSLLDRSLAEENLVLFMHFFAKGHTALQITALHILTDILNVHGAQLLATTPTLLKVYLKALRSGSKSPEVQAAATLAASKLLLGRVVTDPDASSELLKTLVVAYFDPSSAHNQSVRQALNYFLPVFCYSRAENQDLMRSVALDALHSLYNIRQNLEDDDVDVEEDMQNLATIGACLVDWTDPRKCYSPDSGLDSEKRSVNGDIHLSLALDILERLGGNMSKEEKKVVSPLLGKLYISASSSEDKIREAYEEVTIAVNDKLVTDTAGRNALNKLHLSLGKIITALGGGTGGESRRASRSVSVAGEERSEATDRTNLTETTTIKEEDESVEGTVVPRDEDSDEGTVVQSRYKDTLVDDLLTDEEEL